MASAPSPRRHKSISKKARSYRISIFGDRVTELNAVKWRWFAILAENISKMQIAVTMAHPPRRLAAHPSAAHAHPVRPGLRRAVRQSAAGRNNIPGKIPVFGIVAAEGAAEFFRAARFIFRRDGGVKCGNVTRQPGNQFVRQRTVKAIWSSSAALSKRRILTAHSMARLCRQAPTAIRLSRDRDRHQDRSRARCGGSAPFRVRNPHGAIRDGEKSRKPSFDGFSDFIGMGASQKHPGNRGVDHLYRVRQAIGFPGVARNAATSRHSPAASVMKRRVFFKPRRILMNDHFGAGESFLHLCLDLDRQSDGRHAASCPAAFPDATE